jgi:Kef-type K+ transport system membrane component KefB
MLLLLQIAVVLGLARIMRRLFVPLKQPAVIAEMVAGLMLGPSCLGWIAPRWFLALFPTSSLGPLNALSQLGLVLFMFLVGHRVSSQASAAKRSAIAVISAVSMLVPFAIGTAAGIALHPAFAPAEVSRWSFAFFVGAAMSMTAFPVLARILMEHQLVETVIGRIAIACAAFDDVMGWLILAAILSPAQGGTSFVMITRGAGLILYLLVMTFAVRPLLARLMRRRDTRVDPKETLALILLVALASAAATDALGVHALFGAFFAGLVMPRFDRDKGLVDSIEPVTMTVLLPLFFALTGLRTDLHLLDSVRLLAVTAGILFAAIAGKGGASAIASSMTGLPWRDAWAIGVLLNTRGLIELVILNIGLDAGILSPVVFSMLVVMTFVTTCMTSPLIEWLLPGRRVADGAVHRPDVAS